RRKCLQRIESGKNQMTQRVVTAGNHLASLTTTNEFPGMTDGICSRSAGVGNDGQRTGAAQVFCDVKALALRLIMSDASRLAPPGDGRFDCLAIIILPECHTAAGCAQHERDVAWRPARLFPRLLCRE